jgi:hypothetical protein
VGLSGELTGPQRRLLAASYRHIAEHQTSDYLRDFFDELAARYELPPLFPTEDPDDRDDLEAP